MSNEAVSYAKNSRAAHDPFSIDIAKPRRTIYGKNQVHAWNMDIILRLYEQIGVAVSLNWFMDFAKTQDIGLPDGISTVQKTKNEAAIRLLRSWREGDEQEQRETWEYLKRVLDEDRSSYRKLFPS